MNFINEQVHIDRGKNMIVINYSSVRIYSESSH